MPVDQLSQLALIPLHGDTLLNHEGTGSADVDQPGGTITRIVCGRFTSPLPVVGTVYRITGRRKPTGLPERDLAMSVKCQHLPNDHGEASFVPDK